MLLDRNGQALVVDPEGGHGVRFVVTRVAVSPEMPHGQDCSLTLHVPDGERLVGFDNAHPVARRMRGQLRVTRNDPNVWFTSTESFAKVLSAGNRDLLRVIVEREPGPLDELAQITGKAKSNLSRTLKTMAGYGLVRLKRGERGRITPKVTHDRVEHDLQLAWSRKKGPRP